MNHTLTLSKTRKWLLGINTNIQAPSKDAIGSSLRWYGSVDMNIKKSWNKWNLNLQLNDIFKTQFLYLESQTNNLYTHTKQYYDQRSINLSISYQLGNRHLNKKENNNISNEVKTRVK